MRSLVGLLLLNDLPLVEEGLESHVHVQVLVGKVSHLLHVDLLQECADVDALDELVNLGLHLLVVGLGLIVLLDDLSVVAGENLLLLCQSLLLLLELRELELLLNDLILVGDLSCSLLLGIFLGDLHVLLSGDLQVEHLLALLLFFLELFKHDGGVLLLGLDRVLKLHLSFTLSLLELLLLVLLSDTAASDLILKLKVLLVDLTLLSEDLLDLGVGHLLLVVEILDTGLGDGDVDFDEVGLLASLHGLLLGVLGQVAIVQLALLLGKLPGVLEKLSVENLNVLVEAITISLHLLLGGLLLGLCKLSLLDGTIRNGVVSLQLGEELGLSLLICDQDGTLVVLRVHSALQSNETSVISG